MIGAIAMNPLPTPPPHVGEGVRRASSGRVGVKNPRAKPG